MLPQGGGPARSSQEQPGAARSSQGAAREQPGGARRSQEVKMLIFHWFCNEKRGLGDENVDISLVL